MILTPSRVDIGLAPPPSSAPADMLFVFLARATRIDATTRATVDRTQRTVNPRM